jgi:hypothetical protein
MKKKELNDPIKKRMHMKKERERERIEMVNKGL